MRILGLILCLCFLVSSCATTTGSSINPRVLLHQNFPQRVGVFPFSGDQRYAEQATDLFSIGLIEMPYFQEVVDRNKIDQVLQELGFQYSGFVDEKTRVEIGKQLGLDAIFTGNITVSGDGINYGCIRATVKLIDVKTGMILWGCSAEDPRLVVLVISYPESTQFAIKDALKKLEKDLKKIKKADYDLKKVIEEQEEKTEKADSQI